MQNVILLDELQMLKKAYHCMSQCTGLAQDSACLTRPGQKLKKVHAIAVDIIYSEKKIRELDPLKRPN